MGQIKTVIGFTMKDMVRRKSFIIPSIIIITIIILGFNIPNIIKAFQSGTDTEGKKVLILDEKNIFEGNLETLNQMELGNEFEIKNEKIAFDELKEKVNNDEMGEVLIIEQTEGKIDVHYLVKSIGVMTYQTSDQYTNAISNIYSNMQIAKLGLTQEQIQSITPNFDFAIEQTEEQTISGNVYVIMLLSIVLFYAIYFCAYQVSSSITTEKTSKIMETLVTSTKPRTIVLGKTIGIGLVGLIQVSVFVGVALASAYTFLEPGMLDSVLDMSKITPYLGIITIVYFILGYFAYALLYALTGSTVSKPEDIQSVNTPIGILALAGFYLSYFTMMNPTSNLNVFASLFPISSPFCMPFRIMMGLASGTDIAISIAILVITILIIARVAIKIYSNAIFNYGSRMSLKDMVKIYKDKNN